MTRIEHVGVIVPAADEEETLAGCLAALGAASAYLGARRPEVTIDLIIVLDGCRDASADIVAATTGWHVVTTTVRGVGSARRLGSEVALRRAAVPSCRVWTAHTDADSVVPEHWLHAHVQHAELGAAMVLGTVEPELHEPVRSRWLSLHPDVDGHPHVHGANLGVRGDVLDRLGGWPAVPSGEDVMLVERAARLGVPVARVGGLTVGTSGRRRGRAPAGFARYLRELDDPAAAPLTG